MLTINDQISALDDLSGHLLRNQVFRMGAFLAWTLLLQDINNIRRKNILSQEYCLANIYIYINIYRKSSNNSLGAYLQTKIFWVEAYSSGGLI